MLNINKLISSVEACLGWPYVSPGTNDARGIDCSGLFVKAYRDQGAFIYHGSNTIYRSYCSDKGPLMTADQLIPGMAVFKWNPNTPSKFNDNLGDFQHIGLVTHTNPLRIVHASSAAGCVTTDTKLGKWSYWGKLKDVNYGESQRDKPSKGGEVMTATVYAENGQPVNLRKGPSTTSVSLTKVPVGSVVDIHMKGAEWTLISYRDVTGYMMSKFLKFDIEDGTQVVSINRATLEEIYMTLDQILNLNIQRDNLQTLYLSLEGILGKG